MSKYVFYRVRMTAVSPLSIGSGENERTDHDVIRDGNGEPFIPASALVGIWREMLPEEDAEYLFGSLTTTSSKIIVGDALSKKAAPVTVRDNVALDEYKVAIKGRKFDREIVEAGGIYEAILELPNADDKLITAAEILLRKSIRDGMLVGAKTTRGCGKLSVEVKKKEFLSNDWVEFNPYVGEEWGAGTSLSGFEYKTIQLPSTPWTMLPRHGDNLLYKTIQLQVQLKDALSIRCYDIEAVPKDDTAPDYTPMVNADQNPIIPGTSWAGAFRQRYTCFTSEENAKQLFGWVNPQKKDDVIKSKIVFSETVLTGGHLKQITRTAINRFSGGASDGALYTENTYYGGEGSLEIRVPADISETDEKALYYCILDLNNGFLSIGGLSSVGRGLFTVTKCTIDGKSYKVGKEGLINENEY